MKYCFILLCVFLTACSSTEKPKSTVVENAGLGLSQKGETITKSASTIESHTRQPEILVETKNIKTTAASLTADDLRVRELQEQLFKLESEYHKSYQD